MRERETEREIERERETDRDRERQRDRDRERQREIGCNHYFFICHMFDSFLSFCLFLFIDATPFIRNHMQCDVSKFYKTYLLWIVES